MDYLVVEEHKDLLKVCWFNVRVSSTRSKKKRCIWPNSVEYSVFSLGNCRSCTYT